MSIGTALQSALKLDSLAQSVNIVGLVLRTGEIKFSARITLLAFSYLVLIRKLSAGDKPDSTSRAFTIQSQIVCPQRLPELIFILDPPVEL